jgi:hypothetical protein
MTLSPALHGAPVRCWKVERAVAMLQRHVESPRRPEAVRRNVPEGRCFVDIHAFRSYLKGRQPKEVLLFFKGMVASNMQLDAVVMVSLFLAW